jgi:formate dehydrogenase subunit delta
MKVEKLVRMANQIAANFEYGPDKAKSAAGVADHLRRFWTPSMLRQIIEYHQGGDTALSEVAAMAVAQLAEGQSSSAA